MGRRRPVGLDVVKAGGDHGDFHLVGQRLVDDRAEDDVGVFMRRLLDDGERLVHFHQRHVGAAGDVEGRVDVGLLPFLRKPRADQFVQPIGRCAARGQQHIKALIQRDHFLDHAAPLALRAHVICAGEQESGQVAPDEVGAEILRPLAQFFFMRGGVGAVEAAHRLIGLSGCHCSFPGWGLIASYTGSSAARTPPPRQILKGPNALTPVA